MSSSANAPHNEVGASSLHGGVSISVCRFLNRGHGLELARADVLLHAVDRAEDPVRSRQKQATSDLYWDMESRSSVLRWFGREEKKRERPTKVSDEEYREQVHANFVKAAGGLEARRLVIEEVAGYDHAATSTSEGENKRRVKKFSLRARLEKHDGAVSYLRLFHATRRFSVHPFCQSVVGVCCSTSQTILVFNHSVLGRRSEEVCKQDKDSI